MQPSYDPTPSSHCAPQLIDTLDRCKLRARLHDACTALHSRFPLNEALWLRWLASAVAAAGPAPAPRSVASVRGVFELAVGGILSVAVWLQYLDFERGLRTSRSASALDVERLRELFERAAATGGLHVARGAEIWLSWRRFEAAEDDGPALLRVLARQCGVCLGEPHAPRETLGELESWLAARAGAGAVEERTQAAARTAQKAWEDRAPFEAVLAAAAPESAERLRAWEDYVAWEAEQGHPARCQVRGCVVGVEGRFVWGAKRKGFEAFSLSRLLPLCRICTSAWCRNWRSTRTSGNSTRSGPPARSSRTPARCCACFPEPRERAPGRGSSGRCG